MVDRYAFALPSLKLTWRLAHGKKKGVYRGIPEPKSALQLKNLSSSSSTAGIINTQSVCQEASLSTFDEEEPTCYAIESKASVVGWENIRIA